MKSNIENNQSSIFDDEANANDVVKQKLSDIGTPGYQAEFDPAEAEKAGAFEEDAITEEDALEASSDSPEIENMSPED